MQKLLVSILFGMLLSVRGQAQTSTEAVSVASVRAELEAMLEPDQAHRLEVIELEKKFGRDATGVKEAWAKQTAIDAQNIRRLDEIIALYGWPGSKQVGDKAAHAAFLVLQHSDLSHQKKYLPLAREAVGKGEMLGSRLALLEDRVRIKEGQKQIYGSQVIRNSADEWEPLPLEDEAKVDALRASVGLRPIADYLKGFADSRGGRVNSKWMKAAEKEPNAQPSPAP